MLLMIGKPMLVMAKNRLQNLMAASQFLKQNENYRQKHEILKVLSKSNLQLGDAMEIAQTVINESRKHDIPVSLFLGIMKKKAISTSMLFRRSTPWGSCRFVRLRGTLTPRN